LIGSAGSIGEGVVLSLLYRLVLLVIAVLLPVIGIQAYTELDLRQSRERQVRAEAIHQARMFSRELQRMIEGARQVLMAFSETEALRTGDAEACNRFALRLERRYPKFIDLAAADTDGHVFCGSFNPAVGTSIGDQAYFQQAIGERDFAMGDLARAGGGGSQFLPIALPFFSTDGEVGGVVFAASSWRRCRRSCTTSRCRPTPRSPSPIARGRYFCGFPIPRGGSATGCPIASCQGSEPSARPPKRPSAWTGCAGSTGTSRRGMTPRRGCSSAWDSRSIRHSRTSTRRADAASC
jgi:hypothetical protein